MGSILTSVLVLCALTVTGLVVRRELFPPGALLPTARHIDNWRDYQNAGHAVGPKNAAVTIVEFADYECPACGIFAPVLSAVQARHPDDVRIVYRHLPIPLHRFAMPSAVGAECAAHQGRFIQMHDALYKDQKSFGTRSWTAFATEAGVPNVHAFEACTADSTIVATVQKDLQDALALGAHATPTLLVNGDMTSGTVSDGVLEAMIERARRAHR